MAGLFLERPLFSIVTIIVLFLTATSCLYTLSHYRPTLDAQNTTYNGNGTLSERYKIVPCIWVKIELDN